MERIFLWDWVYHPKRAPEILMKEQCVRWQQSICAVNPSGPKAVHRRSPTFINYGARRKGHLLRGNVSRIGTLNVELSSTRYGIGVIVDLTEKAKEKKRTYRDLKGGRPPQAPLRSTVLLIDDRRLHGPASAGASHSKFRGASKKFSFQWSSPVGGVLVDSESHLTDNTISSLSHVK